MQKEWSNHITLRDQRVKDSKSMKKHKLQKSSPEVEKYHVLAQMQELIQNWIIASFYQKKPKKKTFMSRKSTHPWTCQNTHQIIF